MGKLVNVLLLILLSATIATSRSDDDDDDDACVYTIYIRTGSIWKGGTDSKISLALTGSDGYGVIITVLKTWRGALMGPDYNYFERGNLDVFSGKGPCLSSPDPPCWMNLTSDGSGAHHGWYCNYVEVTTTGPHRGCGQKKFDVEQWLARDTSPYKLYAHRDYCPERPKEVRMVTGSWPWDLIQFGIEVGLPPNTTTSLHHRM